MTCQILSEKQADFNAIEHRMSVKLPVDYKAFLTKYNGMVAEDVIIKIEDIGEETMLNLLFSCDNALARTLTLDYWNTEYEEDIPEGSLLIGDFQDGGFLLLILEGEYKGVYYYDHAYTFEASDDNNNTYFLAETFDAFMKSLKLDLAL